MKPNRNLDTLYQILNNKLSVRNSQSEVSEIHTCAEILNKFMESDQPHIQVVS